MELEIKRLSQIYADIENIYAECIDESKSNKIEEKLLNYRKCSLLLNEAETIISNMDKFIENLSISNINIDSIKNIESFIEILSINNINFNELVYIFNKLKGSQNYLVEQKIVDNVEKQVIYEDIELKDMDNF